MEKQHQTQGDHMTTTEATFTFQQTIEADSQLRAVDALVRVLAATAPAPESDAPMCSGCVWEHIVKPLTTPVLGWSRARPHRDVRPPSADPFEVVDIAQVMSEAHDNPKPPPTNDLERWLRTSEAFDVVTDVWLALLHDADPANGHGLPRP